MFNTPNVFDKSCFTGTLSDFWPQKQTMKTAKAQILTAYPSLFRWNQNFLCGC